MSGSQRVSQGKENGSSKQHLPLKKKLKKDEEEEEEEPIRRESSRRKAKEQSKVDNQKHNLNSD